MVLLIIPATTPRDDETVKDKLHVHILPQAVTVDHETKDCDGICRLPGAIPHSRVACTNIEDQLTSLIIHNTRRHVYTSMTANRLTLFQIMAIDGAT